jgi:hypothetical protein
MTRTTKPEPVLWLSDARGRYIPRDFARSFADRSASVRHVTDEQWSILEAGLDHEWYWEAWDEILNEATVTDTNGAVYTLHQDGDLWLVPAGMEWSDEEGFYVWPTESVED